MKFGKIVLGIGEFVLGTAFTVLGVNGIKNVIKPATSGGHHHHVDDDDDVFEDDEDAIEFEDVTDVTE